MVRGVIFFFLITENATNLHDFGSTVELIWLRVMTKLSAKFGYPFFHFVFPTG